VSEASPNPYDTGRPRPLVTSLDMLRAKIDHDAFDAAVFSLGALVVDFGYGDVRALPGSVAWIVKLRGEDKRIGVSAQGDRADAALQLAGIEDRVDVIVTGSKPDERLSRALSDLEVAPDRAAVVGVDTDEIESARRVGAELAIGVARGASSPEQLRRAGAVTVVADLQELLGPT
jgi:phosphoglycolate phosphatase-like HAD superfamily hydrolase